MVAGDGDLLANAVANLIDNAIKYTPSGGTIHVDTRREGTCVTLTVRDSGRGIPAEERTRVGARFYRLDRTVPGWGLGLASVLAIRLGSAPYPPKAQPMVSRMERCTERTTSPGKSS